MHGGPATGRRRLPAATTPVPRDTSRTRPSALRHVHPSPGERSQVHGRNAAHCPGRLLQPQRCFASRCAGRACGAPLTLETSADPAGLTARARPEARPGTRAARPQATIKRTEQGRSQLTFIQASAWQYLVPATGNVCPVSRSPEAALRTGVRASAPSTGDPAVLRMYHGATVALCHHDVEPQPGAPAANVLAHYLNGTDKPTYYQLSIGLSTR